MKILTRLFLSAAFALALASCSSTDEQGVTVTKGWFVSSQDVCAPSFDADA